MKRQTNTAVEIPHQLRNRYIYIYAYLIDSKYFYSIRDTHIYITPKGTSSAINNILYI